MKIGAKIQQMTEYEIDNCKQNIYFFEDQMRKDAKNKSFYAEQIDFMEQKIERLRETSRNSSRFDLLSKKFKVFI